MTKTLRNFLSYKIYPKKLFKSRSKKLASEQKVRLPQFRLFYLYQSLNKCRLLYIKEQKHLSVIIPVQKRSTRKMSLIWHSTSSKQETVKKLLDLKPRKKIRNF